MTDAQRTRAVSAQARRALELGHELGAAKSPGGKHYAVCSCGWRGRVLPRFTHAISEARDHVAQVVTQAEAAQDTTGGHDTRTTPVVDRRVALAHHAGRA